MIKKPVFVTLLKTEELLVLITKSYFLKPIFRVISIFAVLTDCTLDPKVPVLLIINFPNGILTIRKKIFQFKKNFQREVKKEKALGLESTETYKPIYTSAGQYFTDKWNGYWKHLAFWSILESFKTVEFLLFRKSLKWRANLKCITSEVLVTNNIHYFSRNRYQTDFISAQKAANSCKNIFWCLSALAFCASLIYIYR